MMSTNAYSVYMWRKELLFLLLFLLLLLLLLLLRGQGTRIDDADLERSEGSLCSVVDSGEELKIRRGLSPVQLFGPGGGFGQ